MRDGQSPRLSHSRPISALAGMRAGRSGTYLLGPVCFRVIWLCDTRISAQSQLVTPFSARCRGTVIVIVAFPDRPSPRSHPAATAWCSCLRARMPCVLVPHESQGGFYGSVVVGRRSIGQRCWSAQLGSDVMRDALEAWLTRHHMRSPRPTSDLCG
ncbi:hypothetical protein L226DRAFT_263874 [Lentinus tigrinus ALCF2SS1-7]|uniref:uncharacterized protein n=1 Tax=Lentinus tigrinus ALCF2SS1-7 TaxID=1328758 RepID=UPI001165EE6A|nr:hypothetical protein L226DRAFT_263874 [Lentinus tigrinus ALCF2SS1-7]